VLDGRHLLHGEAACIVDAAHEWSSVVQRERDDRGLRGERNLKRFLIEVGHRVVQRERAVGALAQFGEVATELVSGWLPNAERTERAGLRHSGSELRGRVHAHPGLDHRCIDPYELAQTRPQHRIPPGSRPRQRTPRRQVGSRAARDRSTRDRRQRAPSVSRDRCSRAPPGRALPCQ
jgi:hypothetical protein